MSTSTIKSDIDELTNLNAEIKRTLEQLKKLKKAKEAAEQRVKDYLKQRDLPGVKHKDVIVLIDAKGRKVNKPKKDADAAMETILAEAGVQNYQEVVKKIREATRNVVNKESVKLNSLKK
jgi:cytochrome oxidase Cu insertion factor (SCO1/SenC/PrrC family)